MAMGTRGDIKGQGGGKDLWLEKWVLWHNLKIRISITG